MSQVISLRVKGLNTNTNQLSADEGSLTIADNIVINKESVAEMCRGFVLIPGELKSDCKKLIFYQGQLLTDQHEVLAQYSGSFRSVCAHSNLYIATDTGIIKLESMKAKATLSGMPKALDVTARVSDTSGFLPKGQQVAYRIVWGYTDGNKNLILGSPSQRTIVINESSESSDRKVQLGFSIPPGITEHHFYQVYRSEAALTASDELSLVFQENPTVEEIKANRVLVTDTTPRTLSGASLYTNATQEGILQANDLPPIAQDLALFRDCMFYCSTRGFHRLFLTLNHIGGNSGLALGDTIIVAGTSYRAAEVENFDKNEFALFQEGSSLAISHTIHSFMRIMNHSGAGLYAYSFETSDDPDNIGKMLIESRSPFRIDITAHQDSFNPSLPQSSSNDVNKNAVYFSKYQQMEAVPLLNCLRVGSSEHEVMRLMSLRDGLFALTENGAYRISGWTPESFHQEVFDSSVRLVGPETPAVLNNNIFCLTTQGVVAINDVGSNVMSRSINDLILPLLSPSMIQTTRRLAFGLGYESESKYILFVPSHPNDIRCTQAFVYNFMTSTWTRWIRPASCGLIHPTENKIYLGLEKSLLVERKGTENDYLHESNHPIESQLEWHPQHGGTPFALKQWSEAGLSFYKRGKCRLNFKSDLSPDIESISIENGPRFFRTYVPAQKQLSTTLTIGLTSLEPFELEGMSLTITGEASERISR